jgi:hypothetical protein
MPREKEPMLLYIAATNQVVARYLWSNARRKAKSTEYRGLCTT